MYGTGEGRTKSAAADAAATQVLSKLLDQYGKYLVLPFHSFPFLNLFFFIDPRLSLYNACQRLFGNNTSKMPKYVYSSGGPLHDVIWTVTVYSQFHSIISS